MPKPKKQRAKRKRGRRIARPAPINPGIANMALDTLTIIAGMTHSGKTLLAKHIMLATSTRGAFRDIKVCCPTADLQDAWSSCLGAKHIVTEPNDEYFEKLLRSQARHPNRHILLILDDIVGTLNFRNSTIFDKIATSGRHYRLTVMILTQDLNKLSVTMRDNASYMFVTRVKEHSLKTVFELSSGFRNLAHFKMFMERTCRDYNAVRFNLRGDEVGPPLVFNAGAVPEFFIR